MSGNLFELRKDWLIPPTKNTTTATTSKPAIKIKPWAQEQPIPIATALQKVEQCGWRPNCPICKNTEKDWDGDHQIQFHQSNPQPLQAQTQDLQCPQTLSYKQAQNFQHSQSQTSDVPDRYSNQLKLYREWEEKVGRLNDKYCLDCFSDFELDSESDEGEEYRYEHKYEMLI